VTRPDEVPRVLNTIWRKADTRAVQQTLMVLLKMSQNLYRHQLHPHGKEQKIAFW
jgi:hypothetical protein